ncbi:hypothetical protein BT63DRAFT_423538 [Microthyrium microscopicum]|uniref:Chitin-binding type-1 domain-containing protein n=1 Tax=Microthyrium microscopicum TaxID=703497 RepID=A0A6A6UIF9_9PEZI|nr:hypothetical protein BT63DRAFT_423538 [Microthyrium microscopicum]
MADIYLYSGADYCGTGCQSTFGTCTGSGGSTPPPSGGGTSPDGTCGGSAGYSCPSGLCCSQYGYCDSYVKRFHLCDHYRVDGC